MPTPLIKKPCASIFFLIAIAAITGCKSSKITHECKLTINEIKSPFSKNGNLSFCKMSNGTIFLNDTAIKEARQLSPNEQWNVGEGLVYSCKEEGDVLYLIIEGASK